MVFVYGGRRVSGVPLNYSIPGHACATTQCHLVKGDAEFNNDGMRWQIQSAFHEQARFRLNSHAMDA